MTRIDEIAPDLFHMFSWRSAISRSMNTARATAVSQLRRARRRPAATPVPSLIWKTSPTVRHAV
jgi:hypothetical protein